ncbi:Uncharacterised protein [Mycobacterium tuberculosis]|nr:Uncharacterised protein [Mycobacterium tuberculosis]
MAMEMAMMGLLGTVVGASAMGIGGIAKSIAEAYVPGSRLPRTVGSR